MFTLTTAQVAALNMAAAHIDRAAGQPVPNLTLVVPVDEGVWQVVRKGNGWQVLEANVVGYSNGDQQVTLYV